MSSTKAQFKETAKSIGAVLLTAAFMMPAANAATNVELTCHTKPEEIAAVKAQITEAEGMMAVTSHFKNVGTDQTPQWAMATLMMNPKTKKRL